MAGAERRRDFDIIAIGGGSAGLTVAIAARAMGLRVAQVERHRMGGECLWTGCVPSKALLHVAGLAHQARRAARAGIVAGAISPEVDFGQAVAHVRASIAAIYPNDSPEAQAQRGIAVFTDNATVLGAGRVQVGGRVLTAHHIALATGSRPHVPDVPGLREAAPLTNETLFDLTERPAHLLVVGGGAEGVEMAQAFARLGSRVTLLQRNHRLLPRDDEEASAAVRAALEREGVSVHTGAALRRVEPDPARPGWHVARFEAGGQAPCVAVDRILVACGRRAVTDGLGLEAAGVRVGPDGIVVDAHLQTSVPGIWACGDCVGPYRYTHAAETQGRLIVRNLLFPWKKQPIDYRAMLWATFCDPESAHVGLTEAAARERFGREISAVRLDLREVDRAICDDATAGFVKLTLRRDRLVGAQVVAPRAAELAQELALLVARGIPLSALQATHIYPSYAYALHQAADRAGFMRRAASRATGHSLRLLRRLAFRA